MSPLTRPARAWLEERTERLVEMVNERGLTLGDDAARHLLTERVCAVAEKMRIGIVQAQRYLTDDAMRALVDGLVEAVEEEAPGADLAELPRTESMSVTTFGRLIAALSEVAQLYLCLNPADSALTVDDRTRRAMETLSLISIAGVLQAETHDDRHIPVPSALTARIARILTTAADHTPDSELAATLRRDAIRAHH